MTDPWNMPDKIPANDEPDLISDHRPEIDEDRAHDEYLEYQEYYADKT